MQELTVHGRPVPAARMTQRGKFVKRQAIRYMSYKEKVGWTAKEAGIKKIEKEVKLTVTIFLAGGRAGDFDNYLKSISDSLNGIAYIDDQQVKEGTIKICSCASKHDERAEITIKELGGRQYNERKLRKTSTKK